MNEQKFCKDCKHYSVDGFLGWLLDLYPRCSLGLNQVTGKPDAFCDLERQYGSLGCGPTGKRWEAKQ